MSEDNKAGRELEVNVYSDSVRDYCIDDCPYNEKWAHKTIWRVHVQGIGNVGYEFSSEEKAQQHASQIRESLVSKGFST